MNSTRLRVDIAFIGTTSTRTRASLPRIGQGFRGRPSGHDYAGPFRIARSLFTRVREFAIELDALPSSHLPAHSRPKTHCHDHIVDREPIPMPSGPRCTRPVALTNTFEASTRLPSCSSKVVQIAIRYATWALEHLRKRKSAAQLPVRTCSKTFSVDQESLPNAFELCYRSATSVRRSTERTS